MQFVHQGVLVVTPPILFRMPHLPLMAESQFAVLSSGTNLRNISSCKFRKLFTMMWVAEIQGNWPPVIENTP